MTLSLVQDGVSVLETDQLAWLMSEGTIFRQVILYPPTLCSCISVPRVGNSIIFSQSGHWIELPNPVINYTLHHLSFMLIYVNYQ